MVAGARCFPAELRVDPGEMEEVKKAARKLSGQLVHGVEILLIFT
jgi:hypothetical protein